MTNIFNIIKREKYLEKIRPYYESNYIKIITGIRRCGKSEILKQIKDEISQKVSMDNIIDIDLESTKYLNIHTFGPILKIINKSITNQSKYYIFIDEIQRIKKFEELIASIRNSYNCSLFVTGSNSKLLHGKLQHLLTGRAKEFEIAPFTYSESLLFKKANQIQVKDDDFEDFIKWGGMPQRYEEHTEDGIKNYLNSLMDSIITKDIYSSHTKINKLRFNKVSKFIISNSGRLFSALSLAKYLKNFLKIKDPKPLSKSINEYANYLIESFFIEECFPYDFASKKAINGTRKFYPMDQGFKTCLGSGIEFDKSFCLETIIFNELKYRGYKVYYGRNRDKEIDFIAIKDNKKCYIQVTYKIDSIKTFNREYGVLKTIKDGSPKYVFSLDHISDSYFGISHINIIDFLKNKIDISLS